MYEVRHWFFSRLKPAENYKFSRTCCLFEAEACGKRKKPRKLYASMSFNLLINVCRSLSRSAMRSIMTAGRSYSTFS